MTKKLTKVAMTTALAAAAIVPAVVATPAQAAEAEVTFAKAYYSTANGTAAFEAGKLAGVIGATSNTKVTYAEGSNGEVFTMQAFSAYLAVNPTATTDEVLTALSTAGKALSADQVKALDVKEGQVDGGKVTVDPTAVQKTALNEAIAKAEASPKAAELKNAIATAKAVAENPDATQAEVDAAVKALNEAVAEAEAVKELKVESVKAINATIKAEANQQLGIKVNGDKEVTVAELEEAGYSVEFKYNRTGDAYGAKGVVNGTTAASKFEYQVVVTPEEGEAISSQWAEVKVLNASTAVEVTELSLSNELSYVTLNEKDAYGVDIEVAGALNAFGDELKEADLASIDIKSITSSDSLVAYTDGTTIVPRKEGTVEFTVNFVDENLEPVKITVEVKAAQKATGLKAANLKVETNGSLDYLNNVKVLDQYGEEMRAGYDFKNSRVVEVTNAKGEVVSEPTIFATEGTYTVTVYVKKADKSKGAKLGSYTVETVDVTGTDVDEFKLATADDFKIDVNPDLVDADGEPALKNTGIVTIEAYIDGVKLTDIIDALDADNKNADLDYVLRTSDKEVLVFNSSNEEIDATSAEEIDATSAEEIDATSAEEIDATSASVNVKGLKAGEATISLVKVEGAKETVVATLNVTVENSVKLITEVKFNDNVEAVTVGNTDQASLKAAVAAVTNLEVKNIKAVEYVAANKEVIVELEATYGGGEYVLAATKVVTPEETLAKAIQDGEAISNDDETYTSESFSNLTNAINSAKEVDAAADAEIKNNTAQAIYEAIEGLESVLEAAQTTLEEAIEAIDLTEYNTTNKETVEGLIADAQAVLDDADADVTALEEALATLNAEVAKVATLQLATLPTIDSIESADGKVFTITFTENVTSEAVKEFSFLGTTEGSEAISGTVTENDTESKTVTVTFDEVIVESGTVTVTLFAAGVDGDNTKNNEDSYEYTLTYAPATTEPEAAATWKVE